jgi:hypothetical protein
MKNKSSALGNPESLRVHFFGGTISGTSRCSPLARPCLEGKWDRDWLSNNSLELSASHMRR